MSKPTHPAPQPAPAPAVRSPCVNVCRMDAASGWCEGCLRTLDEIAAWSTLADSDRREVLRHLPARRAARRAAHRAPSVDAPTTAPSTER